jgi:hypothetical protein
MGSSPGKVKPKILIGINCFSSKHTALMSKSKDWLAQNQDNVEQHIFLQTVFFRELIL